jgi:hypothetical protein
MTGRRFQVDATPELLEGMPPRFVRLVHERLAHWKPRAWYSGMSCTVKSQEGWLTGFTVQVQRVPGTNTLKVFVDPSCRLGTSLLPVNLIVFLGLVVYLFGNTPLLLPKYGAYAAFLGAGLVFIPVLAVEWLVLRLLMRTPMPTLTAVGAAVRAALESAPAD